MRLILFFLLAISITSCTPRPRPPSTTEAQGTAVAKVGSSVITDKELMSRVESIEKSFPRTYSTHIQKKKLLEEMIHIELLYHQALAEGLDKRYEFKSRLADLYIQQISEQARAKISDQLIQNEFDQNKDQYQQVSARHILIRFGDKKDAKAKQEIISKLTEIRKAALEDPTKFPDLAMKNSQDGSAASGGELGFFNPGMMVAPFSKAAFNLKRVGDISEIVETEFGFHIIQLSGDHRGIEFHKDTIKDRLLRATQRTRLDEELARLKKEIKTEVYEDTLSKLSPLPGAVTTDPETLVPKNEPSNKSP